MISIIKKHEPKYFSTRFGMGTLTKCLSPSTKCCYSGGRWGWMCWTSKKKKMRLMWSPKLSGSCENKSKCMRHRQKSFHVSAGSSATNTNAREHDFRSRTRRNKRREQLLWYWVPSSPLKTEKMPSACLLAFICFLRNSMPAQSISYAVVCLEHK